MNRITKNPAFVPAMVVLSSVGVLLYLNATSIKEPKPKPSAPTTKDLWERSAEIKFDRAKERGAQKVQRAEDTASELKEKAKEDAQRLRNKASEVTREASEQGSSWLRWGADKANEAGHNIELALEKTEDQIKHQASELKHDIVHSTDVARAKANEHARGVSSWYESAGETKDHIKDRANEELRRKSEGIYVHDNVKDMTGLAEKKAREKF